MGHAEKAMRLIAGLLLNTIYVEGKKHQTIPVPYTPYVSQIQCFEVSTVCKSTLVFQRSVGGSARMSSGAGQGHREAVAPLFNDPSSLPLTALFILTASPRLTARGIPLGKGLLPTQLSEHYSSKHMPPTSFSFKQQN